MIIASILNFVISGGILGFLLAGLVVFGKILSREQKREGQPRAQIIILAIFFITLNIILAGAATWIELDKQGISRMAAELEAKKAQCEKLETDNAQLSNTIRAMEQKHAEANFRIQGLKNDLQQRKASMETQSRLQKRIAEYFTLLFNKVCEEKNLDKIEILKLIKDNPQWTEGLSLARHPLIVAQA